jgi:hypothetical protein
MDTNVSLLFILLAAEGLCPKVRVCLALYNERLSIPNTIYPYRISSVGAIVLDGSK